MKKYILLGCLMSTLAACSFSGSSFTSDSGRISLNADEKGMRAFSDMMLGVQNIAKTPNEMKPSHYTLREEQERVNALEWSSKIKEKFQTPAPRLGDK